MQLYILKKRIKNSKFSLFDLLFVISGILCMYIHIRARARARVCVCVCV